MRKLIPLGAALLLSASLAGLAIASRPANNGGAVAGAPRHDHARMAAATASTSQRLAVQMAAGRLATAKYATSLARARRDGYGILTRMIPDMGWHFVNPAVKGFDIKKPPILVYAKRGRTWQLVAFEWVFPERPATPPLPGATYGSFGAACHYRDGTFVFTPFQEQCPATSPQTGAAFGFWHPDLVTLHVWLWYPNPDGIFAGMNPLMRPFNRG